jgi:glycosyltransferase involved in cell wall biosynthesis
MDDFYAGASATIATRDPAQLTPAADAGTIPTWPRDEGPPKPSTTDGPTTTSSQEHATGHDTPVTFAVVIPAYDCASTIESVVAGAGHQAGRVVVVDDGSHDDTAALAERAGAVVLRNPTNLGKGASLRRGLDWCRRNGISHALSMDGDGQHLPDQIARIVDQSRQRPEALVVGSRIVDPAIVSPARLFGNRFANRWVEIACGETIPDTQSGFRVYPVAATSMLATRAARFAFETEVLIRAVRAKIPVVSVPIEVYYPPADERHSHYRPWIDTVRIIFVVLGLIFRLY